MKFSIFPGILILLLLLSGPVSAAREVRSISFPAVSDDGKTVYFCAWGDIWSVPRDGSSPARQLTDNVAFEGRPTPSPDGKTLAFLSDRFGNYDLFTMPESGGAATRLTWDSRIDYPYDWKPDGSAVLGYIERQDQWGTAIYEVPLDGSQEKRLTGPDYDDNVFGSFLGDSNHVIYTRGPGDWTRKGNHAQNTYDLWSFDVSTGKHKQLTSYDGNDMWPQPSPDGKIVYFVSDRDGTNNIWSLNMESGQYKQHTTFKKDGPLWPRISNDGDEIAFEVFGEAWILNINSGKTEKIAISFTDDTKHEMQADTDFMNNASEYAVSPNGKYYAVVVMGDIFILKNPDSYKEEEKPDQDLSRTYPVVNTSGREMHVVWHPKSTKIAYVSDRKGQFDVYMLDLATMEEIRISESIQDEWYPDFAPHGEKLAYYSGNRKLMIYDLKEKKESVLHEGQIKHGPWLLGYDWSPDGKWIAYCEAVVDSLTDIFILNIDDKKPINISFTPDYEGSPSWSHDGKYITFYSSLESGAKVMLLELNPEAEKYNTDLLFPDDMPKKSEAEKKDGEKAEEKKDSDEKTAETVKVEEKPAEPTAEKAEGEKKDEEKKAEDEEEKVEPVKIKLNRIHQRAKSIVKMNADSYEPYFSPDSTYIVFKTDHEGTTDWWSVTLKGDEFNMLVPGEGKESPQWSPDGRKLHFLENGRITFLNMNGSKGGGGGAVALRSHVKLDQYQIWDQMLVEGWRHIRDSFYDKNLHGTDWKEVLSRYRPRIKDCGTTYEYNQLYRQMLGELNASHLGFYSRETEREAPMENTGDLGVIYDEKWVGPGWRVAKVITDGPGDKPGSKLYVGDVILEINGEKVNPNDNHAIKLRNLVDAPTRLKVRNDKRVIESADSEKTVELTGEPQYEERDVIIKPGMQAAMRNLIYEDWVRDNRKKVYDASKNKIGYQHIRSMMGPDLAQFRKELFTESYDKDALIIDVRFNGGGRVAVDIVDILKSEPIYLNRLRDAEMSQEPVLTWKGPIVVLINSESFSNAEIFGHIMRDEGLAKIIGETTGGGVIGTYDFTLLDGSTFRMPSWLNARLNGVDMEGNGVVPDIYVHVDPERVAKGDDNQLDVAINYLLDELKKAKPSK